MLSKDHLQSPVPVLPFNATLSKACQSRLSSPILTTQRLPFPQYNQPQRPILRRCAGSGRRGKNSKPNITCWSLSNISFFCLMDQVGGKETADIYLRGKGENNTSARCGAAALGSTRKMDPATKTITTKSLFRGGMLLGEMEGTFLGDGLQKERHKDCIFNVNNI